MSSFAHGQRVQLIKDCRDIRFGIEIFTKGETGTLGRKYRTGDRTLHDGVEVWELVLDQKTRLSGRDEHVRIAVLHTSIEKI